MFETFVFSCTTNQTRRAVSGSAYTHYKPMFASVISAAHVQLEIQTFPTQPHFVKWQLLMRRLLHQITTGPANNWNVLMQLGGDGLHDKSPHKNAQSIST